jgi:hypothetical protein
MHAEQLADSDTGNAQVPLEHCFELPDENGHVPHDDDLSI